MSENVTTPLAMQAAIARLGREVDRMARQLDGLEAELLLMKGKITRCDCDAVLNASKTIRIETQLEVVSDRLNELACRFAEMEDNTDG